VTEYLFSPFFFTSLISFSFSFNFSWNSFFIISLDRCIVLCWYKYFHLFNGPITITIGLIFWDQYFLLVHSIQNLSLDRYIHILHSSFFSLCLCCQAKAKSTNGRRLRSRPGRECKSPLTFLLSLSFYISINVGTLWVLICEIKVVETPY